MPQDRDIPKPFGEIVPPEEWEEVFIKVRRDSPAMNVFNGYIDMSTRILSLGHFIKKSAFITIDQLVPDLSDRIIAEERILLARVQYYEDGLQHRLSFNSDIHRRVRFKGFPALELQVIPPVQRVSNLYVAYPAKDKPVYLEIPVAGAPPVVRVYEVSMQQIKAYTPLAKELVPRPRDIDGVCVWFIDGERTCFRGTVSANEQDEIKVGLGLVSQKAARAFNGYLRREFRTRYQPKDEPAREEKGVPSEPPDSSHQTQPDKVMNGGDEPMVHSHKSRKIKALIVDDEREVPLMLSEILKIIDVESIVAFDGMEALEKYDREKPDIVFSDIYMPKLNGLMLLNKLKTVNSDLPFVLFTGYSNFKLLFSNSKFKPDGFLPKPLSGKEVIETMFRLFPRLRDKAEKGGKGVAK